MVMFQIHIGIVVMQLVDNRILGRKDTNKG